MIVIWRTLILEAMKDNEDAWENVEHTQVGDVDATWLDKPFHDGYGGTNGASFLVYTHDWIYFAGCYDGSEWVDSIPRNPNPSYIPEHIGG